jgi:hypothetical protein
MNWHEYDERLIRRGELLLDLDFIRGYNDELSTMNRDKEGRPFSIECPIPSGMDQWKL